MALPAGRRGIRANLVKSDGSIDNSSIEELIDGFHDELVALSSRVDVVAVRTAWTNPTKTDALSSLADFGAWVDTKVPTSGFLFGYLDTTNSSAVGLNTPYSFIVMSNSAQNKIVVAYSVLTDDIALVSKQGGVWKTAWKHVALS